MKRPNGCLLEFFTCNNKLLSLIFTQPVWKVYTVITARKSVIVTMTTPCHVTLSSERATVPKDGVELDVKKILMSAKVTRARITRTVSILKGLSTAYVTWVILRSVTELVKVKFTSFKHKISARSKHYNKTSYWDKALMCSLTYYAGYSKRVSNVNHLTIKCSCTVGCAFTCAEARRRIYSPSPQFEGVDNLKASADVNARLKLH
jgi:hypothetical protein